MLKFINEDSIAINFDLDIPEWYIHCIREINNYYKLNDSQGSWYFWDEHHPEIIEEYFRLKGIEIEKFNILITHENRAYDQSIGRGIVFKNSPELTRLILSKTP